MTTVGRVRWSRRRLAGLRDGCSGGLRSGLTVMVPTRERIVLLESGLGSLAICCTISHASYGRVDSH
jgi:hypothetical protein